jgi:CRISPR-associated endonuclease/helicase Cas3
VPREVSAFFEHAPPAPAEVLEAPVCRAVEVLKARACAVSGTRENAAIPGALVLTPALEFEHALTLADLARLDAKTDATRLSGRLIVVWSGLGGLSDEGLLDAKAEGAASDAPAGDRGIGCTVDAPAGMAGVPLRVSVGAAEEADPPEGGWVEAHAWPIALDEEGAPAKVLRIWTPERAQADPALARCVQALADHAAAVECAVTAIGERLRLPSKYGDVLRHAARLHDAGKAAERWQDAFAAPRQGRPYAKTAARRVDQARLDGYRHEFGSLAEATRDPALSDLPDHLCDLALHLIAAHHGRARPVIETNGAPLMPSTAEELARETTLRLARLQQRWGPWGLAWWEALLRCADAAASAALEKG